MPLLASADEKKEEQKLIKLNTRKLQKKKNKETKQAEWISKKIDQKCPDNTRCKHVYVIV
mgnify:CR=1 FL=1